MPNNLRVIYEFVIKVEARHLIESDLKDRINELFDKGAQLELALCIATAKVFPVIKRVLGYTKSCSLVEIKV